MVAADDLLISTILYGDNNFLDTTYKSTGEEGGKQLPHGNITFKMWDSIQEMY